MFNEIMDDIQSTYQFTFNPKNCNKIYFDELLTLMKSINPSTEKFKRSSLSNYNKTKYKCSYPLLKKCEPDEFFFNNNKQIIDRRTIAIIYTVLSLLYNLEHTLQSAACSATDKQLV